MTAEQEYLVWFTAEYDYPNEAREALFSCLGRLEKSGRFRAFFDKAEGEYAKDAYFPVREPLDELSALAEAEGENVYTVSFLFLLLLTRTSRKHYEKQGLSFAIWRDNFEDLKFKLIECKLVKGVWGTFVGRWFHRFYIPDRFSFGRLQFELNELGASYEKDGLSLAPESKVICVHIPRTGERLDYEKVHSSYERAAAWFSERYGVAPVFACSSWILSEADAALFKEGSNLFRFRADYELLKSGTYDSYAEAWRIFDCEIGELSRLPADSSLRRGFLEKMQRGEKLGWGTGVNARFALKNK